MDLSIHNEQGHEQLSDNVLALKIIVDLRINETCQPGAVRNRTYRFPGPFLLCSENPDKSGPAPMYRGASSDSRPGAAEDPDFSGRANAVRLETAPTGERGYLLIFRIHSSWILERRMRGMGKV